MKKTYFLILLLITATFQIKSQDLANVKDYDFANFERSRMDVYGSGATIKYFYNKLDNLLENGEGKVSIMHIGGSHVQADVMTHELRCRLLALKSDIDGGRGLIFPFAAGKSNNPVSFKTSYTGKWKYERSSYGKVTTRLGLTGATLTTSDTTASITIKLKEVIIPNTKSPKFHFNKLRILGYKTGGNVEPIIMIGNRQYRYSSIDENGCYVFDLHKNCSEFKIIFSWPKGQSKFTLTGILIENDTPGITCHNIGVNGASLDSYLKCPNLERDLHIATPDLVIFNVGVNDAFGNAFSKKKFMDNYNQLITIIRRVNPNCAFVFVSNNDTYFKREGGNYVVNDRGLVVENVMESLASQYDCGYIDLFYIMGSLGSMAQWENAGLASRDKVHFTVTGYKIIGDLIYNALYDKYLQYKNGSRRND